MSEGERWPWAMCQDGQGDGTEGVGTVVCTNVDSKKTDIFLFPENLRKNFRFAFLKNLNNRGTIWATGVCRSGNDSNCIAQYYYAYQTVPT